MSKLQQAALPDGMEVRQSSCRIAYVVGFKVMIMHFVNLKGTDVLYYYIFWQTSSATMTIKSWGHWITFIIKFIPCIPAKKACVAPKTRLPGHGSLCRTRPWPNSDKLACMSNYPDTSPKQHQTLQLECVKVKLFQCFGWAMYRDNSCNGFWDGGE